MTRPEFATEEAYERSLTRDLLRARRQTQEWKRRYRTVRLLAGLLMPTALCLTAALHPAGLSDLLARLENLLGLLLHK